MFSQLLFNQSGCAFHFWFCSDETIVWACADIQLASSPDSIWQSGEFYMLLAAQSMAVGTILVRYVSRYADPVMATAYHMLLGGLPLLALSLQQETSLLAERLPLFTGAVWHSTSSTES